MSYYHHANMTIPMDSRIRVFHASPNAPAVDIYANGNLIAKDFAYKDVSQYLPISSGTYNIKVFPSGQITNPVINANLFIPNGSASTIAITGYFPTLSLYPIPEPSFSRTPSKPCVRFIHLATNTPAVDVMLPDGTTIFNDVGYKAVSNYACVPEDTYTFTISPIDSNDVILTAPDVALNASTFYTMYLIGLEGKTPPLEVLTVPSL